MDPAEAIVEKPQTANPKRRLPAAWAFGLLLLMLLSVLLAMIFSRIDADRTLVWLTPAQSAEATKPGALTRLKGNLARRLAPWLGRFYPTRPNIDASWRIYAISQGAMLPAMRGKSAGTNAEGKSAWVLNPAELASFKGEVNTNTGVVGISAPRLMVGNNQPAEFTSGSGFPRGPSSWTNVGIEIDFLSHVTAGSVQLSLAASSTELAGLDSNMVPQIKTNYFVACRALIPDGGGLVMLCGDTNRENTTNYLLIVSLRLVDAKGNPLKH